MTATETRGLYGQNGPSEVQVDMSTSLGSVPIPSPVLTASGCGGTGRELAPYTDLSRLGAFITASLTPQESTILGHLADGQTNRQIAEHMFLAEKTVKNYVSSLLAKLGMERRTQAAVFAAGLTADH